MNKRQKQVEEAKLAAEAYELRQLKAIYNKAAEDIANKIEISNGTINFYLKNFDELDEVQKSIVQSQIYQKQFQESLQKQINGYLSTLNAQQYKSIDDYLNKCYKTGYIGSMYDIAGQGIPVISPIDQKKVTRAMVHNSPISEGLYAKLGVDTTVLKKRIANNIARGISTASDYRTIARNINLTANIGFNKAMRIARTEGHRIQCEAALDAQYAAKAAGADIVKQWDAALDANTRETHRMLDGQIKELDEPFEVDGMQAMNPAGFGIAAMDINCRCALLQRAKWALDADELEVLRERAAAHGLYIDKDNLNAFRAYKEQTFNDFFGKYLKAAAKESAAKIDAAARRAAYFNRKKSNGTVDFNKMDRAEVLKWAEDNLKTKFEGASGANVEFVRDAVSVVSQFERKLGGTIEGLSVRFGGLPKGVYAKYDDATKTLILKKSGSKEAFEKALKEENARYHIKWKTELDYHATDTFTGTIWHELGHAIDIETGQNLSRTLGNNIDLFGKSTKVSAYSRVQQGVRVTKASEAWAENFAAYLEGGRNANKVPLEVRRMIDKYFKNSFNLSLEIPEIKDAALLKAYEEFGKLLEKADGTKAHIRKMKLHREFVEYRENIDLPKAFRYNAFDDVIEYNPKHPNFYRYDFTFAQAHELSHRMDFLEYESFNNKAFEKAVEICSKRAMEKFDEIQAWFVSGGKYEDNAALSDIFSALTKGKIVVNVGHNKEYWKKKENVLSEIFANSSTLDVIDSKTFDEVEHLLKEIFKSYKEIVR